MDIKTVLAVLTSAEGDVAGLNAAIGIARDHEAHLVGLHPLEIPIYPTYVSANVPAEVFEMQRQTCLEAAEQVRSRFESACSQSGMSGEWRCVEGGSDGIIGLHSHYADLVVLTGEAGSAREGPSLVERVVMSVARPVLIERAGHAARRIGDFVVIAWNGRRESARAVRDALPMLQRAKQVSIVVVHTDQTQDTLGELPGADLAHYLARHGVSAEAQHIEAESRDVGDALLRWARGQGADLLVMGAYGHSRFREVLLGGATRDVLATAELPILMSH